MMGEKSAADTVAQQDTLRKVPISFEVTDKFPDDAQMPGQAALWLEGDEENAQFVLARDPTTRELLGFSILVPGSSDQEVEMLFRYVYPTHRRKDLGTRLRLESFQTAREKGYRVLSSGINEVIKVDSKGVAKQNFDVTEGGWQSYGSMLKVQYADGTFPVVTIKNARFSRGNASLTLSTLLSNNDGQVATADQPTLPSTADALLKQIFAKHVPKQMKRNEALNRMTKYSYGSVTFESGLVDGAPFGKQKKWRWSPP